MVQRSGGKMFKSSRAPGRRTTPSRSFISLHSTSRSSRSMSAQGSNSRMVVRLGRPCAWRTTVSGSKPCSAAHRDHTRATAGVESMSTPSRSNRRALQRIAIISSNLHCRQFLRDCVPNAKLLSQEYKACLKNPRLARQRGETNRSCARRGSPCVSR